MIDQDQFKQEVQKQFPRAEFTFDEPIVLCGELRFLARSTYVSVSYVRTHWAVELGSVFGSVFGGHGDSLEAAITKSITCIINGRQAIIALGLLPAGDWSEVRQ